MNELAATNILGNVILVEELIKRDLLKKTVLSVSTEACTGRKDAWNETGCHEDFFCR
jgi:hypothetical protein